MKNIAIKEIQTCLEIYHRLIDPTMTERLRHICHVVKLSNFYADELNSFPSWRTTLETKMRELWREIRYDPTIDIDIDVIKRFTHGLEQLEKNYQCTIFEYT